jgi:hypothetical protein
MGEGNDDGTSKAFSVQYWRRHQQVGWLLPRWAILLTVAGLALAAIAVYAPITRRPFDAVDFSEFIPLLRAQQTIASRTLALASYYANDQGRLNLLPYLMIALKWTIFGDRVELWQTARFLQMAATVVLAHRVLRELGTSNSAAAAGASLYIFAATATVSWVRLSVGEPLGVLLLLMLLLLATRYQRMVRWKWGAAGIALLCVAIAFTKEMLIAALPYALLVACMHQGNGHFTALRRTTRNVGVLLPSLVLIGLASLCIVVVARHASAEAISGLYGVDPMTIDQLLAPLVLFSLPGWAMTDPPLPSLLAIGDLAFIVTLGMGWLTAFHSTENRRGALLAFALPFVLLLCGAVAYAPWPNLQSSYGLPFLLTPALLLALALTALERRFQRGALLAYAGIGLLLIGCALQAHRFTRMTIARQRLNSAVVRTISSLPPQDSTLVGAHRPTRFEWTGLGAVLERYVHVLTGVPSKIPIRTVECSRLQQTSPAPRSLLLITYSNQCGTFEEHNYSLIERYKYFDLTRLTIRADSLRADLLILQPGARAVLLRRRRAP